MATIETLRTDVAGLLSEAKVAGLMAVRRNIREARLRDRTAADSAATAKLEAIQSGGEKFVDAMTPAYRAVRLTDRPRIPEAREVLRSALEAYLAAAIEWEGDPCVAPSMRVAVSEQDYAALFEGLRDRLTESISEPVADGPDSPSAKLGMAMGLATLAALASAAGIVFLAAHGH